MTLPCFEVSTCFHPLEESLGKGGLRRKTFSKGIYHGIVVVPLSSILEGRVFLCFSIATPGPRAAGNHERVSRARECLYCLGSPRRWLPL